jgi:hypothetical protein
MIQRTISGSSNRTTADDKVGPRVVNKTKVARFEVLTATKLNIHVFWDVRQCTPAYSDVSKDHSTFIVRGQAVQATLPGDKSKTALRNVD